MVQFPIIDLSDNSPPEGVTDWNNPPPGVFRCSRGWSDTSGLEHGCMRRAVNYGPEDLCDTHQLIEHLAGIDSALQRMHKLAEETGHKEDDATDRHFDVLADLDTTLTDINSNLSCIAHYMQPFWRRCWSTLMSWRERLAWRRPRTPLYYQSVEDRNNYQAAMAAVQLWLRYPTPSNAAEAAEVLQRVGSSTPVGVADLIDTGDESCQCGDCRAQADIEGSDND